MSAILARNDQDKPSSNDGVLSYGVMLTKLLKLYGDANSVDRGTIINELKNRPWVASLGEFLEQNSDFDVDAALKAVEAASVAGSIVGSAANNNANIDIVECGHDTENGRCNGDELKSINNEVFAPLNGQKISSITTASTVAMDPGVSVDGEAFVHASKEISPKLQLESTTTFTGNNNAIETTVDPYHPQLDGTVATEDSIKALTGPSLPKLSFQVTYRASSLELPRDDYMFDMFDMFMTDGTTILLDADPVPETHWLEWEERLHTLEELTSSGSMVPDSPVFDNEDGGFDEPDASDLARIELVFVTFANKLSDELGQLCRNKHSPLNWSGEDDEDDASIATVESTSSAGLARAMAASFQHDASLPGSPLGDSSAWPFKQPPWLDKHLVVSGVGCKAPLEDVSFTEASLTMPDVVDCEDDWEDKGAMASRLVLFDKKMAQLKIPPTHDDGKSTTRLIVEDSTNGANDDYLISDTHNTDRVAAVIVGNTDNTAASYARDKIPECVTITSGSALVVFVQPRPGVRSFEATSKYDPHPSSKDSQGSTGLDPAAPTQTNEVTDLSGFPQLDVGNEATSPTFPDFLSGVHVSADCCPGGPTDPPESPGTVKFLPRFSSSDTHKYYPAATSRAAAVMLHEDCKLAAVPTTGWLAVLNAGSAAFSDGADVSSLSEEGNKGGAVFDDVVVSSVNVGKHNGLGSAVFANTEIPPTVDVDFVAANKNSVADLSHRNDAVHNLAGSGTVVCPSPNLTSLTCAAAVFDGVCPSFIPISRYKTRA